MNTNDLLLISFQAPYLKKMVLINSLDEFILNLKEYSIRHGYNYEEAIYFFMLESLKKGFFFKYNLDIMDYVYFEAFLWASNKEGRQKSKPLSMKNLVSKKRIRYFVNLQVNFISYFNKKFENTECIQYKVELEKYTSIMYEVSSGLKK